MSCERYTVSILLCYRDILGILGARPISVASRCSGASPELAEIVPRLRISAIISVVLATVPTPGTRTILRGCPQVDDGVVGGCFYRRELERACERVRAGSRSAESASIDSRENLKDGRFRSLRDSSRRLLCSHLTGALVRPRR